MYNTYSCAEGTKPRGRFVARRRSRSEREPVSGAEECVSCCPQSCSHIFVLQTRSTVNKHSQTTVGPSPSLSLCPSFFFCLSFYPPLSGLVSLSLSLAPFISVFCIFLCSPHGSFSHKLHTLSLQLFFIVLLPSSAFLWFLFLCCRGLYVTLTCCGS